MDFAKILIAVDSSSFSIKAAKAGFALAGKLNAAIGIVYVIDQSKEVVNIDLGILPEDAEMVLTRKAEETISQLIKMFDGKSEVLHFMPEGDPEKEILRIAGEWQADIIVMGTHGRTGLSHLLMGSIAEHIIRHATIPVMVISANAEVS